MRRLRRSENCYTRRQIDGFLVRISPSSILPLEYRFLIVICNSKFISDNSHMPYCQTFTAPGLSPAFGCAGTSLPRTHSLMPVAEYYSALVTTSSTSGTSTNTGPATTPTTTTNYPSYFSRKYHRRSSASEVAAFALGVAFALLGSVVCLGIFLARQPG